MPRLYALKIFTQPFTYKIGVTNHSSIESIELYYSNIVNVQVLYFGDEFDKFYRGTAERELKETFFDNYLYGLSPMEQDYTRIYRIGQIHFGQSVAEMAQHVNQVLSRVFLNLYFITDRILDEQNESESSGSDVEQDDDEIIQEESN